MASVIENILRTEALVIENAPEVWAALNDYRHGKVDFADCLIGRTNRALGCEVTATFDITASTLGDFVRVPEN